MSKFHKIQLVQEDPRITKMNFNMKYAITKWILTIILGILFGILLSGKIEDKLGLLIIGIIASLTVFAWYKDVKLFLKRKKRFGRNWKFLKDPLMKELIIIIILVLILYWLLFLK